MTNLQLPEEIWYPVKGYELIYHITEFGKVKSLSRIRTTRGFPYLQSDKILKNYMSNGYWCVTLWKNNIKETKGIHVLLGENFIPNPLNKPMINHINGIKTDIRLINLEWNTGSENTKHAISIGLLKPFGR